MSIHFTCPACNASLKVPDNAAGKKGPCPNCGQRLMVPPHRRNQTVLGISQELSVEMKSDAAPLMSRSDSDDYISPKMPKGTKFFLITICAVLLIFATIAATFGIRKRIDEKTVESNPVRRVEQKGVGENKKAANSLSRKFDNDDRTEEEKARWLKLRRNYKGFWIFLYRKPTSSHSIPSPDEGWCIVKPSIYENGFYSHYEYDKIQKVMPAPGRIIDANHGNIFEEISDLQIAEKRAIYYVKSSKFDYAVVLDFSGESFPMFLVWFWDDGTGIRRFLHAPKAEYESGLIQFLLHLG